MDPPNHTGIFIVLWCARHAHPAKSTIIILHVIMFCLAGCMHVYIHNSGTLITQLHYTHPAIIFIEPCTLNTSMWTYFAFVNILLACEHWSSCYVNLFYIIFVNILLTYELSYLWTYFAYVNIFLHVNIFNICESLLSMWTINFCIYEHILHLWTSSYHVNIFCISEHILGMWTYFAYVNIFCICEHFNMCSCTYFVFIK